MARVDERREEHDRGPRRARGDVGECRKLRAARENERAHRGNFDHRQTGRVSGQPVHQAEPAGGHGDPEGVEQEAATARLQ